MSGKRVVRAELVLQDGTKIKINCPQADLAKAIAGLTGNSQPTQAHTALADRIAKGDKSALTELAGQCAVTPGASVPGTVITAPRASDPKVVHIQETLNGLGLRKGVTDGVIDIGGSTERALGRLDIKVERGQDGSVRNLDAITQGVDNAKRVQDMQKALNTGCGTKLATDGDLGTQTREAALKVLGLAEKAAEAKGAAGQAELTAVKKAQTDLADKDKAISPETAATVGKAIGEHGKACMDANKALAPLRPAAPKAAAPAVAEQPAAERRPAKSEPQPRRQRTAETEERPQQRRGTRQGTPAGAFDWERIAQRVGRSQGFQGWTTAETMRQWYEKRGKNLGANPNDARWDQSIAVFARDYNGFEAAHKDRGIAWRDAERAIDHAIGFMGRGDRDKFTQTRASAHRYVGWEPHREAFSFSPPEYGVAHRGSKRITMEPEYEPCRRPKRNDDGGCGMERGGRRIRRHNPTHVTHVPDIFDTGGSGNTVGTSPGTISSDPGGRSGSGTK